MRNRDIRANKTYVVVYRKLTGQAGWHNTWEPEMDQYVGKTLLATHVSNESGVELANTGFNFPSGALKRAPKDTPQAL